MSKYLVTKNSYFQPFSYDELVKPLERMQQQHDAAQDAYDQLSMQTAMLERYITNNPEDSDAKALYDNYMKKLGTLQNNLWENGYNAQTRRDLSAARTSFASDISRIAQVVQDMKDISKQWSDARLNNPNLVTEDNPALGGMNNFLRDPNYGRSWWTYDSAQLEKELSEEWSKRAKGWIGDINNAAATISDPETIRKNAALKSQLTRLIKLGASNDELSQASSIADDVIDMSAADRKKYYADNNVSEIPQLLVESLLNRYDATGVRKSKASKSERERLFNRGKAGWSSAVLGYDLKDFEDPDYAEDVAMRLAAYKKGLDTSGMNQIIPDEFDEIIAGDGVDYMNKHKKVFEDAIAPVIVKGSGKEYKNALDASAAVYSEDIRMQAYPELGFDMGRGKPTGELKVGDKVYETRWVPSVSTKDGGKGQFQWREKGSNTEWYTDDNKTALCRKVRDLMNARKEAVAKNAPELLELATFTPDEQYDLYKEEGIDFSKMPLSRLREYLSTKHKDKYHNSGTYLGRNGTDAAGLKDSIVSYLTLSIPRQKTEKGYVGIVQKDWRTHDGQTTGIHKIGANGLPEEKALRDPNEAFIFDSNGNISNIDAVYVNEDGIMGNPDDKTGTSSYVIVHTQQGGLYSIGLNMIKDDGTLKQFIKSKDILRAILNAQANKQTLVKPDGTEYTPRDVRNDLFERLYMSFMFTKRTQHKPTSTKEKEFE